MKYEKRFAIDGNPMYYRDGKRIKRTQVPKEELVQMDTVKVTDYPDPLDEQTVDEVVTEPAIVREKSCLFCRKYGDKERFINTQTVYLCEDHYYSTTLGKIAQKIREEAVK